MKYFHRTSVMPALVMERAVAFLGARMGPAIEAPRHLVFAGSLGQLTISVAAEGGHYTLVEAATDQPGESELDKLAKRFLAEVHQLAEPSHPLRGSY